jgi:hypothetical protein
LLFFDVKKKEKEMMFPTNDNASPRTLLKVKKGFVQIIIGKQFAALFRRDDPTPPPFLSRGKGT